MAGTAGSQRGKARSRLREAQRRESTALMAVEAAAARREQADAKLADVMQRRRAAVADADEQLARARAELVDCSGLQRAAALLDIPVSTLRAAVRTAKTATSDHDPDAGVREPAQADTYRTTEGDTASLSE